jgi:ubiquinone/menaquinone biosynthesis methyltransferase
MAAKPTAGAEDRAPAVREMFNEIAPRYDRANRVLSLGLDQAWRRKAIAAMGDNAKGRVLDLCCGTLDLTRMLVDHGAEHVTAADFSEVMLSSGGSKIKPDDPVDIVCEDARNLPFEDNSMDAIICGFGLRNVPELEKALAECSRLLKPGGTLVVLDFFQPVGLIPRLLQSTYNRLVVPVVGGIITGFGEAYTYLNQSIDAFSTADEFVEMLADAGITATHRNMFPPVAQLIHGVRDDG